MTNKDKFIEVFGFEPDTETMIPVCPPRGVECPFMDDGIYSECHCDLWWGREYKEPTTKNDLGIDCIKKSDAINIIQDMHGLARADVISDAVNRIITMPSVTPQSCEDAISRKAVLEMAKSYNTDGWDRYTPLVVDVEDIEELPSVTPQEPRKGHWIIDTHKIRAFGSKNETHDYSVHCDKCNYAWDYTTDKEGSLVSNFCPNCGADMREVENDTD